MSRVTLQGLLIAALALALVACSQATPTPTATLPPSATPSPAFTPDPVPEPSHLTEEIPPCTPAPGSSVDPCEPLTDMFGIPGPPGHVFWLGDEPPRGMQYFLAGTSKIDVPHVVVRGTYLPDTVRCTTGNLFQPPAYVNQNNLQNITFIYCYADVRVNAYVLGSGPSKLTVLVYWYIRRGPGEEQVRLSLESVLSRGNPDRMIQGIIGREAMLFIGPSADASIEAWQVMSTWDVQRMPDDTVVAVHPLRKEWEELRDDWERYLSQLEVTLPSFGTAVTAAHQERVAANGGRTRADPTFPMLVSDANKLRTYYREVGAYDHEDGPPLQPPSVGCASAAAGSGELASDCTALLAAIDALRGTATLNWGVERSITEWDGVTTSGTPLRVTRLELRDKSLSGSVPAELGRLSGLTRLDLSANSLTGALPEELGLLSNLAFIRLAGNLFTGCVPHALRNVADSDLESVGIPYCPAPVCIQPFPDQRVFNPTLQLKREPFTHAMQSWDRRCRSSHALTHNAQFYTFVNHDVSDVNGETVLATMRVNIKMTTRHDDVSLLLLGAQFLEGLEPDAPIVATAEPVEAEAGALRTLEIEKVVPYGSYSIEVRARNPGDAVFDLTAAHVEEPGPPAFAQDSYTFSVAEDAGQFTSVGIVSATDPGDEAVTYRITSGAAGKFSIDANEGIIVVRGGLDYETTPTYTLTVEARNPKGLTGTGTVTINVTDVAGR